MLKIDRYEERLKSIQFKITCKERFKSLESDISIVLKAFKALQNSEQFPKLLELVLTLGNYLNSGRFNGKLHGFKISSLNKLVDMKSTDNKFSLLYFLVGVIETKFPEVKNFVVELQDVIAASKVPFQTLKEDMTDLSVNLKLLEKEIEYRKNLDLTEEKKDSFLQKYEDFYEKVKLQFKNLNKNFNLMEKNFLNVIVFFGEDDNISKVKPDEFLNLFKTFLDSYQERELKKKEREMASLRFPTEEGEEMKGVMDNLLDSLKKGSVSLNHGKGGGQRRIPRSHFRQENSETSVIDRSLGRKTSIGQLAKELLGKLQSDQVEIKESLDTLA
ncbi:Disheveled-associated activator of morphogenesis 1 [Clydaea vesicula]|uniref:Disheveled-associated activator of morphogenesis 1 n=1 Tax=Clydaea vesicula TaxID=447962 RepID=A0AAD5U5M4_9FUNG|nr:Disheveled-associated activator of morphogenesis 1 [Clydaea vesicula]